MRSIWQLALLVVLGGALVACAPTYSPVPSAAEASDLSAAATSPDPAVALANKRVGERNAYREGYVGEGDDLIHYVEAGEGQTIIFVHGFPAFWYLWHEQMEAFRPCYRVVAIDAPGSGLSARPADTAYYRIDNLAERLDAAIAELSPDEKVILVGHDWGGALAWSYAQHDASRLDRLAVFSAPPFNLLVEMLAEDPEQRERSGYMERFGQTSLADIEARGVHLSMYDLAYRRVIERGIIDDEQAAAFRRATADAEAINAGMAWYRANVPPFTEIDPKVHSWPAAGSTVDVPTLLVRGEEDRTFVKRMGVLAQNHASDLTVKTIEDVAHWTPFEDAASANALLADFMGAGEGCLPDR